MAPERRKALTLDAIGSLVNAMANAQPVLFIVEDAHWIDPSTLELLDLIVARVAALHILLLVTFRPDFPPRWRTEGRISTITLIRLSARETSLLVASVAGGSSLPGAVVDQIVERTDGVPLFVEELTKNLLEFCEDIDDRSRVVDAGIVIPSSLQDSLMARLDRLGAAKILAQVAAVIGRTFERDLLARVSGADESTLKQMLDRLTESGLVQRIGGVDATYQFKHALVRDCAYDSLLKKVRREHHAKIAETLEAPLERGGLPQANLIAMLAHHNFKARRWEKALKYANACGQKALARSAYRESVGYLNQALAALEHLEDSPESVQLEIDTRIMLRGAHGALGDTQAMLDEIRRADALARQIGDQHRLGLVSILLTYSLSHLGLLAEAIVAADRARKVAQSSNDRMLAACTEVAVSHAHHYSGTSRRLVESLTPVGRYLRDEAPLTRFGSPMTNSVTCFGNLAMAYADLGEFSDAVKSGDTTQEIAGLTDRPLDLAYAHLARGYAYVAQGNLGDATECLGEGLSNCRRNDLLLYACANASSLVHAYALDGRYQEAELLLQEYLPPLESMGFSYWHVTGLLGFALVRLEMESPKEARRYANQAHELSKRHGLVGLEVVALRLLAATYVRGEALFDNQAIQFLGDAIDLARRLGMRPQVAHCRFELGRLHMTTERADYANAEIAGALEEYQDMGMQFWSKKAEGLASLS